MLYFYRYWIILIFFSHIKRIVEWSGEVRNIAYSADGKSVSVVYRVTLYGTDAEVLPLSFYLFILIVFHIASTVYFMWNLAEKSVCAMLQSQLYNSLSKFLLADLLKY